MKKILAMLLALMMILGMATLAQAEENSPAGKYYSYGFSAEGYGDRVFINKVESAEDYAAAEGLARRLACPVVAGSLHQGVYTCLR